MSDEKAISKAPRLSIVVPVYNEEENIEAFHAELTDVLKTLGGVSSEICYVDDGSSDRTRELLRGIAAADSGAKVIFFTRNFGQTAAISAGISSTTGEILIPMDADLQNDPHDIPKFLQRIDDGYDVVSGWRRRRKDPFFSKKLPSRAANWIISRIGGVPLHDYGCSMKAYRREVIRHVRLYGEMHRFIPLYASQVGAKITEIEVNHRARKAGRSKYGLSRIYKVSLDLITAKFMGSYLTKPIYFFGSMGFLFEFAGVFFGAFALFDKYVNNVFVYRNPKILLAIFLFILGSQFIMLGILAEFLVRIYFESQHKETYFIKEQINIESQ